MSRARAACALLLLCVVATACTRPDERELDFADLGNTQLVSGGTQGLTVILADRASTGAAHAIAVEIASRNRSAAIVDLDSYFARVAASTPDCFDASTLLDVYAQQVQQELRFAHFGAASLIGTGQGAAFVPVLLAAARAGLFAAGVSVGPPAPLTLPARPCGPLADTLGWTSTRTPVTVPATLQTLAPWVTGTDTSPAAVLATLDGIRAARVGGDAPVDLPLVELPQPDGGSAPWFALVISGDGGWANIDKDIAEELGRRGIAVLGWNSLRYFWEAKTPDTAGADLARVVRHYTRAWHKPQVLLIGYSLGADVLPFMVSRAPPDVRAALAGMVLLNPAASVDFQFHISNWLPGSDGAQPWPLQPELERISGLRVQCLYGSDDDPGLCPQLQERADTRVQQLPGDHHYDGDYAGVTRTILEAFPPQAR